MSERHLSELELAGLMELPAGHPRRAHLDACPRCRARLAQYHAFLAAPADVPAHESSDADQRLERFLQREVAGGAAPASGANVTFARRFADWWRSPVAAPALAFAAVVALIGGVSLVMVLQQARPVREAPGEEPLLRGGETAVVTLAAPEALAGGGARLRWTSAPDADAYEVLVFSPALDEVGRLGPVKDSSLEIPRERLWSMANGDTLLVRVRALRAGATLGESRLEPLVTR